MMHSQDIESLAKMLDKNATFVRPAGQSTGFSLQEDPNSVMAATATSHSVSAGTVAAGPASIPLPATVIDQQLHLPVPSQSKQAQAKRAAAEGRSRPRGNEIWTQEELRAIKKGVPVSSAPAAAAAAAIAAGMNDDDDEKVEPEHTVLYQQNITAEDVYLGVDFTRDNSSASSDGVVVRVEMPKVEKLEDISITVEAYRLGVSSADYLLSAPLPRKVKQGVADAKWDAAKKVLIVRLTAEDSSDEVKLL